MSKATGKSNYTVPALTFFMNLRGASKGLMNKAQMAEFLSPLDEEEEIAYRDYMNIMLNSEYLDMLRAQGWFHKNYETVRKLVETYFAKLGKPFVYNKPAKCTGLEEVAKLLFFCALKGYTIPCLSIKLAQELKEVVDVPVGIKVVNSGPGTGKTTTGVFASAKYMNEGVLVVAYTNAAVNNFINRLYEIISDTKQVSKDHGKAIWVTTIDTICRSNNRGVYKNVHFDKRIDAARRDIGDRHDLFVNNENDYIYLHLIIDEAQDIDDARFEYLFEIFRVWKFKSMTIIGDPRQRMDINAGAIFLLLFNNGTPCELWYNYPDDTLSDDTLSDDEPQTKKRRTEDTKKLYIEPQVTWCSAACLWKMIDDPDPEPVVYTNDEGERQVREAWYINCKPLVFEFHVTYRFRNPLLLRLCNRLSKLRPNIHSSLVTADHVKMVDERLITKFTEFKLVAAEIEYLISQGVKPSLICLMSPITEKQSKIKTEFDAIQQLLSTTLIICDKNLGDSTIYATSVISVKGLEFDYVFMVGASNYPDYLSQKLRDVNDGMSMNFVANTRARIALYYLTDESRLPPVGVPLRYIGGEAITRTNYSRREIYLNAIRSSIIQPQDYLDYETRNRPFLRIVLRDLTQYKLERNIYHNYTYEIISAVLCEVGGYNMFQVPENEDDIKCIEAENHRQYILTNKCIDCTVHLNGLRYVAINKELIHMAQLLRLDTDPDNIEYHRSYALMMNNRDSMLKTMTLIAEAIILVKNLVLQLCGNEDTVEHESFGIHLKAPIVSGNNYAIIFTESIFLAAECKSFFRNKTVIMIGLETGRFIEITLTLSHYRRYAKVTLDLYTLTCSITLMLKRARFSLSNIDRSKDIYFVDTEFTACSWNKSGTIYDIAVINAFKPYLSFVTYTKPDPNRFRITVGDETLLYNQIRDSPTIPEFISIFNTFVNPSRTIIYYYHAIHDIAPFYETHTAHDDAWGIDEDGNLIGELSCEKVDWLMKSGVDYGYTFINGRVTSGAGSGLKDVYNITTGSVLHNIPHLIHHVAISDAMMLMEYVFTRDHAILKYNNDDDD